MSYNTYRGILLSKENVEKIVEETPLTKQTLEMIAECNKYSYVVKSAAGDVWILPHITLSFFDFSGRKTAETRWTNVSPKF